MNEEQNKFARNDAARAAQRKATHGASRADAIAQRDRSRDSWRQHNRGSVGGGLILDQRTLSAKAQFIAETAKVEPQSVVVPDSTISAVVETWLRKNPQFYNSDFNSISVRNFLLKAWHEKSLQPTIELLDSAFEWLTKNGHLETDPRIPRKRGDVARASAPSVFEFVTPQETKELEEKRASEAAEKRATEDQINRSLPFSELQRLARSTRGVVSRDALMRHQG